MDTDTKKRSSKRLDGRFSWKNDVWSVRSGQLVPRRGRKPKVSRLFEIVAEKLPFECLPALRKFIQVEERRIYGVYLAHDSMGFARYGGRGDIFARLSRHKNRHKLELVYFSFYVIANMTHEKEIETVILRAAGPQMTLNTQKVALNRPGDIRDYEPGTDFFVRRRLSN